MTKPALLKIAKKIRFDILRMSYNAQSAHSGGSLSCVEIVTALYFQVMKVNPKNPLSPKRDRLVFSKAHDAKVLYAALAERGFFPVKDLETYEKNNGRLPGHTVRFCAPGVEYSAGSLGHGLPMAVGIALAAKKKEQKHRIFVVISDGECDEGTTWESALFASQNKLENLTVIIDYNKLQGFGYTKDILNLEPLRTKWQSFGFRVFSVNGHSFPQLIAALSKPGKKGKPHLIIAHTIKGKGGVPRDVNQVSSQYKPPSQKDFEMLYPEFL